MRRLFMPLSAQSRHRSRQLVGGISQIWLLSPGMSAKNAPIPKTSARPALYAPVAACAFSPSQHAPSHFRLPSGFACYWPGISPVSSPRKQKHHQNCTLALQSDHHPNGPVAGGPVIGLGSALAVEGLFSEEAVKGVHGRRWEAD